MTDAAGPSTARGRLGQLAATVSGAGPPVVLLHGNGEDGSIFGAMASYFDGYTTVALDSLGHGGSAHGPGRLSLARLAVATAGALATYRQRTAWPGRFALIGFSDGANVALELALHRPELVSCLVLMGGNTRPSQMRRPIHVGTVAGYGLLRLAGLVSGQARRRAEIWKLMVGQPLVTQADLRGLALPVLVMVGERDVVARSRSLETARLLPAGEWVELPGHGHLVPVQAPEVAGRLAAGFVERWQAKVGAGAPAGANPNA